MNLNSIANAATSAVNPNIQATLSAATGYTTAQNGTQMPTYATAVPATIQVQQLSTKDLAQIDSMNIQGDTRKVYLNGNWNGIVRPDSKGGDLMTFSGQNWKILTVTEQWPEWTAVIVVRQF